MEQVETVPDYALQSLVYLLIQPPSDLAIHPDMKASHSSSVVAVELSVQALTVQAAAVDVPKQYFVLLF